ncbi:reverse transcriptase domain-containing protein [Tanacetum coccineum]
MRTRSSSNLIVESSMISKRRNCRRSKQIVEPEIQTIVETPVVTMADTRTMSEFIQAPNEHYRDAIVIPAILAENLELKVGLPQLGAARIWLKKEPPRSILTWEDLVSKFVNDFFPPSKTTNLKNDITNFQQKFEETFSDVCDRFKELLRKCPDHSFLELHQIDMFYNALIQSNQDSLNAAAGVSTTTSSSSPSLDVTALTDMVKELVLMNKANQQASVKVVDVICVTCGGPHSYYECLATDSNTFNAYAATGTYNQGGNGYRPQGDPNYRASTQMGPPGFPPLNVQNNQNYNRNEATLRAMQTQMTNMKTELRNEFNSSLDTGTNKIENQNNQIMNMLTNLTMQKQNPLGSGSLPSNTIANPRGDVKAITTQSGVAYDRPKIPPTPSPPPKEVECETEATKDKPDVAPKPNPKPSIPYPSRLNDQKLYALLHMPKFVSMSKSLLCNKEYLFELASTPLNENCSAVLLKKLPKKHGDPRKSLIPCDFPELDKCLALADLGASINLMPLPVWKKLSLPKLTLTCMTLELANRSVAYPKGVTKDVFVKAGKFHFPTDFVVVDYDVDPWVPLILGIPFC